MKTKINLILLGLALVITTACSKYPPDTDRVLEDLAVITQYDTKVNFSDYKTYVITQNVWKVTDKDTTILDLPIASTILARIETNMKQRGFVPASSPATADLGIAVTYYQNTYLYAYYGGWWGYYGWGYYYPYYPVYYGSYSTGLAFITATDLKVTGNNTLYMRWDAAIRGLLNTGNTESDILEAVDQAFIQTPQFVTK